MLELKDTRKSFGSIAVIKGLDLFVKKGNIMVILGASGCGKTTLLRLIAGFEQPDAGCISIDGQLVSSPDQMIPPHKRRLGMIFQDLALWPHMTVRQNIEFGLKGMGLSKRQREEKIMETMKFVKLSNPHFLDRYPNQLSGGEKQRVAIARTISQEPGIILMDEPLSNLDPSLKRNIRMVIQDLKKKLSITILYVTHDQNDAISLADSIAIMDQGKIENIKPVGAIKKKEGSVNLLNHEYEQE